MSDYSKQYSKDVAFVGDYPGLNPGGGDAVIKVGSTSHRYDSSVIDETSALPKKDIEALIADKIVTDGEGFSGDVTVVVDISVISGAVKKRTIKHTYKKGRLITTSLVSNWI